MIATFATILGKSIMTTVSTSEAGRIVQVNRETVRRWVHEGRVSAQRAGLRGDFRVDVDDLRKFAGQYNYPFNEDLAKQLAKG